MLNRLLYLQIQARFASAKFKHKLTGINLIGLIIASGLGVFILSAIVKISLVISDNMQLIKSINELESSARALEQFFTKVISTNGYGCDASNPKRNEFFLSTTGNVKFPLWFTGGNINAIFCSGKQATYPQKSPSNILGSPGNVTIFMKRPTSSKDLGYITCLDSTISPLPWVGLDGNSYMPLVSKAKIADFHIALTYRNLSNNLSEILIENSKISLNVLDPFGLSIAIVLKSTSPVFNGNRVQSFSIFGDPAKFTNVSVVNKEGDAYLYKLVLIQVPFEYTRSSGTKAKIT